MATTVGKLATDLGRSKDEVLDACRRIGVVAWSEHTPLDDGETQRIVAALPGAAPPGAPPPPGAPGAGAPFAAPGYGGPPPPPGSGPLPPPPGAFQPPGFGGPPPPPGFGPPPPPGYGPPGAYGAPPPPGYGQPPYPMMQPLPKKNRVGRVVLIVVVVLVGLGIVGAIFGKDKPSNNEEAGGELAVGDCWDDRSGAATSDELVDAFLNETPCSEPHDAEVYFIAIHPAGFDEPFPGDQAMSDFASEKCFDEFEAFVGAPYETSSLDITFIFPQAESWDRLNARQVSCSLVDFVQAGETPDKLTGSMRGSGR